MPLIQTGEDAVSLRLLVVMLPPCWPLTGIVLPHLFLILAYSLSVRPMLMT